MSKNSISTDQELRKGDYLLSDNKNYKAIFQDDGNFVIYKWSPTWATDTVSCEPFRILLQQDNNLVMYTEKDKPLWSTGTNNKCSSQRMRLTLTDDSQLVLDKDGDKIWSSATSTRRRWKFRLTS